MKTTEKHNIPEIGFCVKCAHRIVGELTPSGSSPTKVKGVELKGCRLTDDPQMGHNCPLVRGERARSATFISDWGAMAIVTHFIGPDGLPINMSVTGIPDLETAQAMCDFLKLGVECRLV